MAHKSTGLAFLVLTLAVAEASAVCPMRVIATQSVGSSLDTITRIVANKMSEMLGQQLVIDNRGRAGVIFTSMAGVDTVHVPYKGGRPMATTVVAGEARWCIAPAAALVGHIKAGRMRALAISSKMRSPLLPELPTIDEAGVPGYEYTSWNGIFASRDTPRPAIDRLHATKRLPRPT
ncbi:MAG: tripartite tricarboxylate transporter substrate-binding protein [Burkholderiales bacterium]